MAIMRMPGNVMILICRLYCVLIQTVSLSVIQPKLNLIGSGDRVIALITRGNEKYSLSYGDYGTRRELGNCYLLTADETGIVVAQLYGEHWDSLNSRRQEGVVKISD